MSSSGYNRMVLPGFRLPRFDKLVELRTSDGRPTRGSRKRERTWKRRFVGVMCRSTNEDSVVTVGSGMFDATAEPPRV